METVGQNYKTTVYIQSESEFQRARKKALWETFFNLITRRHPYLNCFDEISSTESSKVVNRGLQDIPLENIVGSAGRSRDFTRHFLPTVSNTSMRDRWRNIYTLVVTGRGVPPIEVFKVGSDYYVEDGHHRVSVAKYLGWQTIHAHVMELFLPPDIFSPDPQLCFGKSVC